MLDETICRVLPPIVARHPEILRFPVPVSTTTRIADQYKKIRRRITSLIEYKLTGGT